MYGALEIHLKLFRSINSWKKSLLRFKLLCYGLTSWKKGLHVFLSFDKKNRLKMNAIRKKTWKITQYLDLKNKM